MDADEDDGCFARDSSRSLYTNHCTQSNTVGPRHSHMDVKWQKNPDGTYARLVKTSFLTGVTIGVYDFVDGGGVPSFVHDSDHERVEIVVDPSDRFTGHLVSYRKDGSDAEYPRVELMWTGFAALIGGDELYMRCMDAAGYIRGTVGVGDREKFVDFCGCDPRDGVWPEDLCIATASQSVIDAWVAQTGKQPYDGCRSGFVEYETN